ncbi:sodium/glutamate symporter [Psychromonas sp. psych-6C06]|uniref:sodium/glutamate symporter n=1 Tax=Psychromonas sp. psych-6C06 TaxID=2058089 RepID=UPI000C330194|nr:sodium/glutamate symporter [Psychromonas sp. psych-6C06]PKF63100.1 sodium/glutamate symporter [Psychromonas sp. psych-6C06]
MNDTLSIVDGVLSLSSFFTVTIGIIVLFVGRRLNERSKLLQEFSIPEPVTGGILFSLLITLLFVLTDVEIKFDLMARDVLLVYFFTTIGINASLKDLLNGGKPLVILLIITIGYMVLQNFTGITVAQLFGQDPAVGLLGGSVSLIGGHGTAIAWAPRIGEDYGVSSAMEIGIASATFGLILASLMGGPIAKYLITRNDLKPVEEVQAVCSKKEKMAVKGINSFEFLDAVFAIHICAIFGFILNEVIAEMGLQLPLFVTCLFAGIVITNLIPKKKRLITGTHWPTGSPAITLIADISLGTFLAMSLMSMQLWTLVDLAGPIFAILAAQFIIAILVNLYIVFPAMGKNYNAAVVCAGFGGISLGSTPTAMANMSAVSQKYGYSKQAFIIVPLVCAFFIDLVNAVMIPLFLSSFA